MSIAGHPGQDRTLAAARRVYYWPTMCVDIDRYVAQCISCAKHKGTAKGPSSTHATISTIRMSVGRCFNRLTTVARESFRLTVPPGVSKSFLKICGSSTRQKQNNRICGTHARDSAHLSIHNANNTTER